MIRHAPLGSCGHISCRSAALTTLKPPIQLKPGRLVPRLTRKPRLRFLSPQRGLGIQATSVIRWCQPAMPGHLTSLYQADEKLIVATETQSHRDKSEL